MPDKKTKHAFPKSIFPLEFDSQFVYINGKREQIKSRQNIGSMPILRYPKRPDSVIGHICEGGYVYFSHDKIAYRGYFKVEDGRHGIIKLTALAKMPTKKEFAAHRA